MELEALAGAIESYGPTALLITINQDDRPHSVAVEVTWDGRGGRLRMGAGSRTAANVGRRPGVSLVWPALVPGSYSLIVDGMATVAGGELVVTPEQSVRHRTPVRDADSDVEPDAPSCITVLSPATS